MRVIVNPKYTHLQKQIEEIPKFFADEGKVDRSVVGDAIEKYRLFDVNAGTSGNAGGES